MTNIIDLPVITRLPTDPDKHLKAAVGKLETVVILGWDKDGDFYFASSEPSGPEVVWLLGVANRRIHDIADDMSE